jgi:hypothetical protein
VRGQPRNMTQPPANLPPNEVPFRRRHMRAPQGDGEVLIDPHGTELRQLLDSEKSFHKFDRTFQLLGSGNISSGCKNLIEQAIAYTRSYREVQPDLPSVVHADLILAGHQPELFHPGVWLKNFALDRLARPPVGIAINLVVDNDVAGSSIRIPAGTAARPHWEEFAIDEPFESFAYEERPVVSPAMVKQFGARLRKHFDPARWYRDHPSVALLGDRLTSYLELPREGKADRPLGETLARARHRLEQDFGLQTLELPLSHVAQSEAFRNFAMRLLMDLPRFQQIYNQSLAEYRVVNKIRSRSHPVPELAVEGDWLEAPFWIWTTEKQLRKRLFVRNLSVGSDDAFFELSDRDAIQFDLHSSIYHGGSLTDELQHLESQGVKIRPRALITTMYARLFLSDLFIHGIGGAKYDELTDAIIRRFFGVEPPAFMTVTGTVRLPIPRPAVSAADVRSVKQLIREIRFHPERFVNDASPALRESATQFAAQKQELLRQHQFHFRGAAPEEFRALDDLNRQLSLLLTDVEIRLRDELKTTEQDYQTARILGSREFSFVLHPADTLPEQLKRMASS